MGSQWVKSRYRPSSSTWPGQCVGKTGHCGAEIIEIFSGRAVLNGKSSGGADAVCARVSVGTSHRQAWALLLIASPWVSKSAAFPSSHYRFYSFTWKWRANSCRTSLSNTHIVLRGLKKLKTRVCKLWRWTLIGTAAVELMWHIWEDGAERRQELWEGATRKR